MGQRSATRGALWVIPLGLVLLAIGAAALVPRWIDWTHYRPELMALIGDVTGRRVAIDGDVRLTLLPTPSLRAEDVRLGEAAGERSPIFLRATAIQADLDLGALITGAVRVSSLRIDHPVAEFLDLPTGTDFLGLGRASLDRVTITDGEAGSPLMDAGDRLTAIDAELVFGKPGEAPRLTATFRHRTLPWRLDGSLGRALALSIGPRGGGPTLRLTGTVAEEGEARFVGKLKGEGSRGTELAHLLGFGVPKPAEGRFALDAAVDLSPEGLSLHDLTLILGEQRIMGAIGFAWTDQLTWHASLRANRFDLDAFRTPWQRPLVPRSDSSLPNGTLTLAADALDWRSGVLRQARISAAWDDGTLTLSEGAVVLPGGTDIAVSGAFLPDENWRFAGRGEVGGDDPRPALVWAGADPRWFPRGDRWRRLSGTLALSGDRDHLSVDRLDVSFDNSRVTGAVRVAAGDRPTLSATLTADRLPLDALQPLTPWAELIGGDGGLAPLKGFDGSLALTIGESLLIDHPLRDLRLTAQIAGGVLSLTEATAHGFGGPEPFRLSGTVDATQTPPVLALKANATWADTARTGDLLRVSLPARAGLEGRAALALNGPLAKADLALALKLGSADAQIGGTWAPLAGTALLDLDVLHPSQPQALRDWTLGLTADGDGPVKLTGRLDLNRSRLYADSLALRLPDLAADARGTLAFPVGDGGFKLDGGVGISVLRPAQWRDSPASKARLADALLWPLEVDIAVRLGLLDQAPYSLTDLAGQLRFANGTWRFDDGTAKLYEGTLELSALLAFGESEPHLTLNLDLKDAALGRATAAFFDEPDAAGRLSAQSILTAKALTLAELPTRLSGTLAAQSREGQIGGIDLAGLRAALAPATEGNPQRSADRGLALANAFTTGKLPFKDATAEVTVGNGSATVTKLTATVPDITIEASGTSPDLGPLRQGRARFSLKDGDAALLIADRNGAGWQRRLEWSEK